jgi:hypothetical protein
LDTNVVFINESYEITLGACETEKREFLSGLLNDVQRHHGGESVAFGMANDSSGKASLSLIEGRLVLTPFGRFL